MERKENIKKAAGGGIVEIPNGIYYALGEMTTGAQGKHVIKGVYLVQEVKNLNILHGRNDNGQDNWYNTTRRGYNGQVLEGAKKAIAAMNATIKADIKKGRF